MGQSSRGAVVLLALLLLFSSVKCMMACVSLPCETPSAHSAQNPVPPCHQHHHGPANEAPPACAHPLILADTAHSAAQLAVPDLMPAFFSPAVFVLAPLPSEGISSLRISSPPGLSALSSVILRI